MKNIFYFLTALTFIFIIGCSKNEDLQLDKEQTIVLPDVNLTEIVENFGTEQATFHSYEEYAAFSQKFGRISEKEQQELLKEVKFETIDTVLNRAYEGMNNLETREEFVEYLKQYEEYLELVELPDGEEEVQEKEITGHSIYPFLNKNKIIKIGKIYYKYFSEICIQSENKEKLLRLKSTEEAINSGLRYYTAFTKEYSTKISDEVELRWGDLNKWKEWEKTNDKFWCKNKRKIKFLISIYKDYYDFTFRDSDGYLHHVTGLVIRRDALLHGYRKGIPCIWFRYKTVLTWNDFHTEYDIKLEGVVSHQIWTGINYKKYCWGIERKSEIASINGYGTIDADCQWTTIKSKVRSRPVYWLKINWHN